MFNQISNNIQNGNGYENYTDIDLNRSTSLWKYILLGEETLEKRTEEIRLDTVEISNSRLSFYEQNKDNPQLLLDTINFYHGVVGGGGSSGVFMFGSTGMGQMIPVTAIPRINADTLGVLHAIDNELSLETNSYCAYKGVDGKLYACAFNGKVINRAYSECVLGNDMENMPQECSREMTTTLYVISRLVSGGYPGGVVAPGKVKECLGRLGIEPGIFKITVDGKTETFELEENGAIWRVKEQEK